MAADRNGARARFLPCILLLLLLTFFWRLLDFSDEALNESLKMSFGPLLLTGILAATAQLVIISLLLVASSIVIVILSGSSKR